MRKRGYFKKLQIWKELLPPIGMAELHRLLCRLKRHAKVISWRNERDKIAVILGYNTMRDRINTRVLLSSWIGKRSYRSIELTHRKLKRS
jgi:hypothetical protein